VKSTPPERVWAKSFPVAEEIERLLAEMQRRRFAQDWITMLQELGTMSADVRLAVNLKRLLALNLKHPVDNILTDGLTNEERMMLLNLDSVLPQDLREIAHGLLNVHERWVMARAVAKYFRLAKAAHNSQVLPKLLDNILGE
jgi:uncharacterized protein YjgD (DUF1641 family)